MPDDDLTPAQLQARLQAGDIRLIDVREPHEWAVSHIAGAELMPLDSLPQRLEALRGPQAIALYCRMGGRSRRALEYLAQQGIGPLYNLAGGITAWSRDLDPALPLA